MNGATDGLEREHHRGKTREEWLKLRSRDLTSTEVGALFGISPYVTKFELWHRKKAGDVVEIGDNVRMKWGNRLEAAIAEGIAEDNEWTVKPFKDYISLPNLRLGSSFDYACVTPEMALLEIKNVDSFIFKDGWMVDGDNLEAPLHIEMQSQHQMLVSGIPLAYIGALVGGNRVTIIKRKADAGIHGAILKKAAEFWKSIDDNVPPPPDFARDAEFISKLYGYAEPGKIIDSTEEVEALIGVYKEGTAVIKQMTQDRDALKAKLLTIIGDSEKVLGDGFTISAGMVGESHVEYDRKSYRNFRVHFKKEKENRK